MAASAVEIAQQLLLRVEGARKIDVELGKELSMFLCDGSATFGHCTKTFEIASRLFQNSLPGWELKSPLPAVKHDAALFEVAGTFPMCAIPPTGAAIIGRAKSPALAVCAAILRARIAIMKGVA
jgi:hypothetical protein